MAHQGTSRHPASGERWVPMSARPSPKAWPSGGWVLGALGALEAQGWRKTIGIKLKPFDKRYPTNKAPGKEEVHTTVLDPFRDQVLHWVQARFAHCRKFNVHFRGWIVYWVYCVFKYAYKYININIYMFLFIYLFIIIIIFIFIYLYAYIYINITIVYYSILYYIILHYVI